jgi:polysaccharide biosynthesis/export protein
MQRLRRINESKVHGVIIILIIISVSFSCVPIEKLRYLNDINELAEPITNPRGQTLIMPYDKISVQAISIDEKSNTLLSSITGSASQGGGGNTGSSSYLVDEAGNIDYPFVGKIKLGYLTTEQASSKLAKALSEYVSTSSVTIKIVEGSVTIMGEVGNQGLYTFSQDRLTIYEALALGKGISRFGDRKNVILIRQEGDKIMHHKLDLTSSKIAGKEYFYIQSNDIIIVEPLRSSSWFNYNNSNFATVTSTLTIFIAIVSIFFRNKLF